MITVHYIGRRGNNLFQHILARILHEMTGRSVYFENINRDLEETYGIHIGFRDVFFDGQEDFPNLHSHYPGDDVSNGSIIIDDRYKDLFHIINESWEKEIILHGFFQRWYLYDGWENKIREWLQLRPCQSTFSSELTEWGLHIRHEDYPEDQRLPLKYYLDILSENNVKKFGFIGKKIEPDTVQILESMGGIWIQSSSLEDMNYLKQCRNIICSNSTFSWWGAYLSNAEQIYIPQPSHGYWSKGSDQELFIPERNMILREC